MLCSQYEVSVLKREEEDRNKGRWQSDIETFLDKKC